MKKIQQFQITGMTLSGFKSYQEPTELAFGPRTVITGGNGVGKTSIADAIAFAVTGQPFFGERGIDRLHNEVNPDVSVCLRFVDEAGTAHTLTRTRRNSRMTITFDGYEIRQLDLTDMFGERDVFLSIFNPLYFIEELGDEGKNLLELYLPMISHEAVLAQLTPRQLILAILSDDVKTLCQAPGVGRKTAQRVVLELKDKFRTEETLEQGEMWQRELSPTGGTDARFEAIDAMMALGYSRNEAGKAVNAIAAEGMTTEDILKAALKKMVAF